MATKNQKKTKEKPDFDKVLRRMLKTPPKKHEEEPKKEKPAK